MRIPLAIALLLVVGGCATPQQVEQAQDDVAALRTDLTTVSTDLKSEVTKLRDDLVETNQFNEEQVAVLDGWREDMIGAIDTGVGQIAEKVEPIAARIDNLNPADVQGAAEGIGSVGRIIGGPWGTGLGILAAALIGVNERRGRRRAVRGTVASVEHARNPDGTVDFTRAAELQALLGIRREVRDATTHASSIIGSVSSKQRLNSTASPPPV